MGFNWTNLYTHKGVWVSQRNDEIKKHFYEKRIWRLTKFFEKNKGMFWVAAWFP